MSINSFFQSGSFAAFIGVALVLACLVGLGRIIGGMINGRLALCFGAVAAVVIAYGGHTLYEASMTPSTTPSPEALLCVIAPVLLAFGMLIGWLPKYMEARMNSRRDK